MGTGPGDSRSLAGHASNLCTHYNGKTLSIAESSLRTKLFVTSKYVATGFYELQSKTGRSYCAEIIYSYIA